MATTAVTESIRSLDDLERCFAVQRVMTDDFFLEWQQDLPKLTPYEQETLDQIRDRVRYQRKAGAIAEGGVNAIFVSPLLSLAGFYDPPFRLRSEQFLTISTEVLVDEDNPDSEVQILRGRVDFLVLQDQFWQAVIESKETSFDIEMGIPQLLTYMMGAPAHQTTLYGMVTNGNHSIFVKLQRLHENTPEAKLYEFSDVFSLLPRQNKLYDVLKILKKIGAVIQS
jgi:hypothetical protein